MVDEQQRFFFPFSNYSIQIWARITRSLNLMHSKKTKEVGQVKEQMEQLKMLYRRAKQDGSRNSPFYKQMDVVLGMFPG